MGVRSSNNAASPTREYGRKSPNANGPSRGGRNSPGYGKWEELYWYF